MMIYRSWYVMGGVSDFLDVASSKMIFALFSPTEEVHNCAPHCRVRCLGLEDTASNPDRFGFV